MVKLETIRSAIQNNNLIRVKDLVQCEDGYDIHEHDDYVLRCAASYGHIDIVKYLLTAGADVTARGCMALYWAIDDMELDVLKLLIENVPKDKLTPDLKIELYAYVRQYGETNAVVDYLRSILSPDVMPC